MSELWLPMTGDTDGEEVLGVDVDDVLFPGTHRLADSYAKMHGVEIDHPAVLIDGKLRGTLTVLKEATPHLSEDEVIDSVEEILRAPDYHDVEPLPGSVEGLTAISVERKRKAVAVTSRPSVIAGHTHDWIGDFFPGVFQDIRILGDRWGRGAIIDKFVTFREFGATDIIDDLYRHVVQASQIGASAVLFGRYSWNDVDDSELPAHVTRCENWPLVVEHFNGC